MEERSPLFRKMARVLLTLLGAGIGAGIAALILPIIVRLSPLDSASLPMAFAAYALLIVLFALLMLVFSRAIVEKTMSILSATEERMTRMPLRQVMLVSLGIICGFAVAFLLTQLVLSAGASLLTWSFSALMYLVLGYLGMRVGRHYKVDGTRRHRKRRERGLEELLDEDEADAEEEAAMQPAERQVVLDASGLIDGRVLGVVSAGFLQGSFVVPECVKEQLHRLGDSSDPVRRARARRGLDMLLRLQDVSHVLSPELSAQENEVDVALIRYCKENDADILTCDGNLAKLAGVSGVRVLSINDLANALKPDLVTGEECTVRIQREGKEAGQGVGYLDDGTMLVVENAGDKIGQDVPAVVTTVLQTGNGRIIFAKLKDK